MQSSQVAFLAFEELLGALLPEMYRGGQWGHGFSTKLSRGH